MQLFLWLNVYFVKAIDPIFYGFSGVTNPLWENTTKACMSQAVGEWFKNFSSDLEAFLMFSQHPKKVSYASKS